jgi:hypothetical protein
MFSNEAKREREREREREKRERESVRVWARRDGVLVAGYDVSERGHERRVEAN